jgi:hypothetical protein
MAIVLVIFRLGWNKTFASRITIIAAILNHDDAQLWRLDGKM